MGPNKILRCEEGKKYHFYGREKYIIICLNHSEPSFISRIMKVLLFVSCLQLKKDKRFFPAQQASLKPRGKTFIHKLLLRINCQNLYIVKDDL